MPSLTGSEILVKALEAEGAETIFSIPGGQLLGVYEAIRRSPVLDLIVPRQEGAGALMACGHALARGKPGVVMSTVGAGVVYELSGLSYAWMERIPVMSISPQVQSWRIKPIQENLQALDQDEMYSPMTKFHSIAYHVRRIPQLVSRAYKIATMPEPGPVHLDLPLDIAFERKSFSRSELGALIPGSEKTRYTGIVGPDPSEYERARALIERSARPLAFVGRMASRSGCAGPLDALTTGARIPALSSHGAFSALPGKSALRLSTCDLYPEGEALDLFSEADLILYIEPDAEIARFARTLMERSGPRPAVQISSHPEMFNSFAPVSAVLAGSAGKVLEGLCRGGRTGDDAGRDRWTERLLHTRAGAYARAEERLGGRPGRACARIFPVLNTVLTDNDFVVCEGNDAVLAAKVYLRGHAAGRAVLLSENAPAGSGFPLAIGARAGTGIGRVFLVTDRRNFKYHCRELQTASHYRLGVCSIVLPDTGPLPATEPDFALLAGSLGVKGRCVRDDVEGFDETMVRECAGAGLLIEFR